MNNQAAMMSSATAEWGTPQAFYDRLDAIFHFGLDPCATHENHKAPNYYTKNENGLILPWKDTTFMNPPYGREIGAWVSKAQWESVFHGSIVVCLVPARTDTRWFQLAFQNARAITFLPGRLKFVMPDGRSADSAPFPTALITFAHSLTPEQSEELRLIGPTYRGERKP